MTWLTWRQFRAQAITAVAALAAFAILLVVSESRMSSLYAASGIIGCHGGACAGLASQFLERLTSGQGVPLLPDGTNEYVILYFFSVLVILIVPAVSGTVAGRALPSPTTRRRPPESASSKVFVHEFAAPIRWMVEVA